MRLPCLLFLSTSLSAQAAPLREVTDFPVPIHDIRRVAADQELGLILGYAVGPDGSFYLADQSTGRIIRVGPDGRVRWTAGRGGRGPGEFQMLYRIAVRANGEVVAYDRGPNEISVFDAEGRFVRRRRLPYFFGDLSNLVLPPDGGIIVSGVTTWAGFARDSAIHVFDDSLVHLRSFGPLPETDQPEVLVYWGAGGLALAPDGTLLYTRTGPYEIYRLAPSGARLQVIQGPPVRLTRPEEATTISYSPDGSRMTVTGTRDPIVRPLPARSIGGGWLLAGLLRGPALEYQLLRPDGTLAASGSLPAGLQSVQFDPGHRIAWLVAEIDDEPVLLRGTYDPPS